MKRKRQGVFYFFRHHHGIANFSRMIIQSYRTVSIYYRIVAERKALLEFFLDENHALF
jgi:hypothetical protein